MKTYKNNDVVSWYFKYPSVEHASDRMWCKSGFAIFRESPEPLANGGKFYDTYWSSGYKDGFSFAPDDGKIEFKYLGNLEDYKPSDKSVYSYYLKSDIMNISHANNSCGIYLRKNAKRNAAVMLDAINELIEQAENEIKYITKRKQQLQELHKRLTTEDDINTIYI